MQYLPRVADDDLRRRLANSGAVLIEGAKWCGKTQTALQSASSALHVDTDLQVEDAMQIDPTLLLDGPTPRLLDEWQWQPRLWDYVRRAVDERQQPGQFILTGSATPDEGVRQHSGAGRFSVMRMRPMSLWESGQSSGAVSWRDIRRGEQVRAPADDRPLLDIAQAVVRGGWPATVGQDPETARQYVLDYLQLLTQADVSQVSNARRDPIRVRRLIASLARNVATTASLSTILTGVSQSGAAPVRDTAAQYLLALEQLMVVENQPAWSAPLRDSATVRLSPKRHFVCPSLAAAAMGATAETLLREPKTLTRLFESLAVRDLRVYTAFDHGEVLHYHDSRDRVIDAIIDYPDGWMAVAIKLGVGAVDAAANNLVKVVATIDTQIAGLPDAMVVITGAGPAYQRKDGVVVVPLGFLRD